jgi:hypothetical protein
MGSPRWAAHCPQSGLSIGECTLECAWPMWIEGQSQNKFEMLNMFRTSHIKRFRIVFAACVTTVDVVMLLFYVCLLILQLLIMMIPHKNIWKQLNTTTKPKQCAYILLGNRSGGNTANNIGFGCCVCLDLAPFAAKPSPGVSWSNRRSVFFLNSGTKPQNGEF